MLAITISGNLVAPPRPVFTNVTGQVYAIRLGCSNYKMENKQVVSDTIWCSGLVAEKKIKGILSRLQKGTFIVCHAPDATMKQYQSKDGLTKCEIDLRYIGTLEAGNLPKDQQIQNNNAAAQQIQPVQQSSQYQPHPSQQQAPWQQQQQYQQPTPQGGSQFDMPL